MTVLVVVLCGHQALLLYARYRRELAEWEEVIEKEKVEAKQFIKYVCVGSNRFGDSLQSPSSLGVLSVAISWFCLRRRDILPSQGYGRGEGCELSQPEARECRRSEDVPHTRTGTAGAERFRGGLHPHCRVDQTVGEYSKHA